MNALYRELADELELIFIDIGPKLLDENGKVHPAIAFDSCHLTEWGYKQWAVALRQVL